MSLSLSLSCIRLPSYCYVYHSSNESSACFLLHAATHNSSISIFMDGLSLRLPIHLTIYRLLWICLFIWQSISTSIYVYSSDNLSPSICPSVWGYSSNNTDLSPYVYLPIQQSIHLCTIYLHLSVYACLSICHMYQLEFISIYLSVLRRATILPRIQIALYVSHLQPWSRSRSRSRNIYFSNISWRNMNNQSQPSFTQHPSGKMVARLRVY